jgi:hypothetical protein
MSLLGNCGHDIRPLPHISSNQKKGSANIVFGQDIEQIQSLWIVWPIIERKGKLFRAAR